MKRYYLHIRYSSEYIEDPDGEVLPGDEAALEEAKVSARHLVSEALRSREVLESGAIEVVDEEQNLIGSVPFRSVVKFKG